MTNKKERTPSGRSPRAGARLADTPASVLSDPAGVSTATATRLFWIGAGLSFVLSLVLYVKTMAASASFWDAGEFIAAAYTLGVPHSPGTPLYVLVGRVFTLFPVLSIAERVWARRTGRWTR